MERYFRKLSINSSIFSSTKPQNKIRSIFINKPNDNKKEYLLENGKLDTKKFGKNIFKVIFSVGIAEIVYVITRCSIHFYLLTSGHEHYLASIIAHLSSALMFTIIINLGVKITKLFNNRHDHIDNKVNSEFKTVS